MFSMNMMLHRGKYGHSPETRCLSRVISYESTRLESVYPRDEVMGVVSLPLSADGVELIE